ncbi:hypothetical protein IQ278_23395 [Tolypothrix sp. LEGE 11397]|nr:hypothetical protein [Tolypothrix sp. PCC 7712]MBE9085033.1 hypothetical protein [Tolypothrix sp. LEGE 11397]UYD32263.1 hypothetical protein HG267_24775 [Tolypothrix sp. PCC 7601]
MSAPFGYSWENSQISRRSFNSTLKPMDCVFSSFAIVCDRFRIIAFTLWI